MTVLPIIDDSKRDDAGASEVKISLRGLRKNFGGDDGFVAIEDISIDIRAGEFFVIVGPSGCGKTTLLRILGGLETQTKGAVEIHHADPARKSNAMVFQGDSLFPWYTVYDNAAYGLRIQRLPESKVLAIVQPLLEMIGLWQFRDRYPHQLSGGMRQRVSIVRAFANDPEILLMDEPFSALDEQNRVLLHQELLHIWEATGKTVVFITHSVDEAVTLGDRIMVMTAHPGRAKAVIDVPFPRPREVLELRGNPAYGQLVFDIWEYLREEVQRARIVEGTA